MEVFRITLSKWSNTLQPSGYAGRWNSNGVFTLYTSSNRALASLENIVHRSGEGLNQNFKCTVIKIPKSVELWEIKLKDLPNNWFEYKNYSVCQKIGNAWVHQSKTAVLKVPSAIIKKEYNILINPNHKEFRHIKIDTVESFEFDPRLIQK